MTDPPTPLGDRERAALLALACGDALGATLERMSRARVRRAYPEPLRDIVGGGWLDLQPGETTDDTAMALCVLRGIRSALGRGAAGGEPGTAPPASGSGHANAPVAAIVSAVGDEFAAWYAGDPVDVGNTCALAIRAFREEGSWSAAEHRVRAELGEMAGGNGALMRTLPVSFFWPRDLDATIRVSRALTRMTHPHDEAEWCSTAYNALICAYLARPPLAPASPPPHARAGRRSHVDAERIWIAAQASVRESAPDLAGTADRLERRLSFRRVTELTEPDIRSSGYCVDTLEAALWAFWTTVDLESCVVRAANLGDDADTVAAVAGGLAGAAYGPAAIPGRWREPVLHHLPELADAGGTG